MIRPIKKIINAGEIRMGPNRISQPLPAGSVKQVDPFLLIHHAGPKQYEPGNNALQVDAHPHRGFDPVTFVFSGELEHKDSLGNHSIIGSGGVQWINAGKGIVHSEKASPDFREKGGLFEIIQLWINVPRSQKYEEPGYQGFRKEDIPLEVSDNNKVSLFIFAGHYKNLKGPVDTREDLHTYTAYLNSDSDLQLEFDPEKNVIIYQLGGSTLINDQAVSEKQMVIFENENSEIVITSTSDTRLLILAGLPIREPIFHYGPFVLNSKDELIETIKDYESGKMGTLPD